MDGAGTYSPLYYWLWVSCNLRQSWSVEKNQIWTELHGAELRQGDYCTINVCVDETTICGPDMDWLGNHLGDTDSEEDKGVSMDTLS